MRFRVTSFSVANFKNASLILCFPIFILLLSSFLLIFNPYFYNVLFSFSNAHQQAQEFGQKTIDYLEYKTDFIQGFQQEEVNHMFEVKDKIFVLNVLFIFLLIMHVFNITRQILIYGSLLHFILLFLFAILPFNWLFIKFHEVFFTGQWSFPSSYVMVQVFNQKFFYLFFLHIVGFSLLLSVVSIILAHFLAEKPL
ncbi:hypothetical protein HY837_06680 [archaeon]|nr:hypothetical protein [archaeon]